MKSIQQGNRQSNLELLRLVAMFMVLAVHANYSPLGAPTTEEWHLSPLISFGRVFLMQATIICVNLFVFISGWFGLHIKRDKIFSLLFQVIFCTGVALIIAKYLLKVDVGIKTIFRALYLGSDYWFVVAYFILLCISPVINSFVEKGTKKEVASFLIAFWGLSFIYGMEPFDFGKFHDGFSGLHFIGLYTLARYIRVFSGKVFCMKPSADISIYLISVLLAVGYSLVITKWDMPYLKYPLSYNNPLVLVGALFFFLAFTKIQFKSTVINFLGPSAFTIYLVHAHPLVLDSFYEMVRSISTTHSGIGGFFFIVCFLIGVCCFCIALDMVRRAIWNLFRIIAQR